MEIRGKLCNQTAVSQVRRADRGQILHIKAKETEGGDGVSGVMSTPLHRLDNRDDRGPSVMIEELNFQYINILQVS